MDVPPPHVLHQLDAIIVAQRESDRHGAHVVAPVLARALECQQDNPKSGKSWKRYEAYKSATTVAEFLAKGGTPADLAHDVEKGFVWYVDEGPHVDIWRQRGLGRIAPSAPVALQETGGNTPKPVEMRRVGDAEWRWFGSQKDAAEAFGVSARDVTRLINDPSKATEHAREFEARPAPAPKKRDRPRPKLPLAGTASAAVTPRRQIVRREPGSLHGEKPVEMRRVGDAEWRYFGSRADAAKAFGISAHDVSKLINDPSTATEHARVFEARPAPAPKKRERVVPRRAEGAKQKANGKWANYKTFPGREFDDLDEYRAAKKQHAARRAAYSDQL